MRSVMMTPATVAESSSTQFWHTMGEERKKVFKVRELFLLLERPLGSPFQDPHFSEMVMTLLLPSPPSSQGTDGEKHDIHGTLTEEWTEPPSKSVPASCLSKSNSLPF